MAENRPAQPSGVELGRSIARRSTDEPSDGAQSAMSPGLLRALRYDGGEPEPSAPEPRRRARNQRPRLMPPRRITGPNRDLPDAATGHSPNPGYIRPLPGRLIPMGREPVVWDRIDDPMRPLGSDYRSSGPSPVDRGRIPPRGAMDHA